MRNALRILAASSLALAAIGALSIAPAQAAFGLNGLDTTFTQAGGAPLTQAGAHPYEMSTKLHFNTIADPSFGVLPDEAVRDLVVGQIPGFVGNNTVMPRCSEAEFTEIDREHEPGNNIVTGCPDASAVGIASVELALEAGKPISNFNAPVYNLTPPPGVTARLGFVTLPGLPVTIDVSPSQSFPYNLVATVSKIAQAAPIYGSTLTLWGTPGNPAHDPLRGQCLNAGKNGPPESLGECHVSIGDPAFLTVPRSCQGSQQTDFAGDSWPRPGTLLPSGAPDLADPAWFHQDAGLSSDPAGFEGCDAIGFEPSIAAATTTSAGESPSGLDFDLNLANPGLSEPGGIANSDVKKVVATLPAGITTNPSAANGLGTCSIAQYEGEALNFDPATGCPNSSKVGSVEVVTPLLNDSISGSIYLARQQENPFNSLLALYMVIRSEKDGILIRQAGKVEPDPVTGQLRTTFDDIPQLPFSKFHLHFREGPRAPLVTPAVCGQYTVDTELFPYAHPNSSVHQTATLSVGNPCAQSAGQMSNSPSFSAGTTNNTAGAYAPFVLQLTRPDRSQQISSISTTLPEGLLGKLAGIPYCPESGIAQAASRTGEGQGALERSNPSCPAASEVGTVTVAAGAGTDPYYVSGHAYLAGPYKGAPLSLEIITPAIAGPFDLGVVAVRTALQLDLFTTEITAVSDPIPTILHGLPLDVRSIAVDVSRPNFTLNPTSCEPKVIAGSATSTLGSITPLTQYFQVAKCNSLAYKPALKLMLKGKTKRSGHPSVKAVLTVPHGATYANTARIQVGLPHSEFLDQGNLDKVCTQPQLRTATCPKRSVYGSIKVWTPLFEKPLKGNVYIGVGFGHKLPDLVTELNGQVRVLVHGRIDTTKQEGIRNTFELVPDAPYSRVVLQLKGGKKYGLIENSENICRKPQKAAVTFRAQNGKLLRTQTKIQNDCGKKQGKKKGKGSHGK